MPTMSSTTHTVPPSPLSNSPLIDNNILLKLYRDESNSNVPHTLCHKNGRKSKLCFVPVCTTNGSFRKVGQKCIDNVIMYMSNEKHCETYNEMIAAPFIINYLAKMYPSSFQMVANGMGLKSSSQPTATRLDKYETSALMEYCDITEDTAYNKLNRLYRNIRGHDLLAPKRDLETFATDAPKPNIYSTEVACDTKKEKKKQTADCIETTMHDNICQKMERYLTDSPSLCDVSQPPNETTPMFCYKNPGAGNDKSLLGVIGTDHGQKHSQFQLALHLLPSQKRRVKKDKAFGILNIPFSTIKCSKENSNILHLTAPSVNDSIKKLENSKLMCVRNDDHVHCFWIA